ncbi:MAG: tRNA lysidine(34) synthetase TilS [Oscillospiraceae bacterium]|nr:tRNA lysidine(34) synthetase TilS [Oscillospiraceae bacterium]
MSKSLAVQALETIRHYSMLRPGDAVVAGLSGGADSVALLHWLCSLREEHGLDLCAAHLNHGLRGQESDEDEAFSRALCEAWGVPLHAKKIDLSSLASGIEEVGRNARYAFFAGFERKIALAHTLSDRMETFLMNAGRGSALRGLCSIPPVRGQIIRPLIECTRAQVEQYCADNNLSFRTDSTNSDTGYRRNYFRYEVLPLLAWEPEPLRRMFRSLEADEAYLASQAKAYKGDIQAAPEAIKGRLLREMLVQEGREPSQSRMKELEKQLHVRPVGAASKPPEIKKTLHIAYLDENFIKNLPKIPKEGLANCLDCDTIIGGVVAGRRRAGDCMRLCNGAGTKSFKKLCQERNVVPAARVNLLVARDDLGPVWIEGFGCAHRCRITENTARAARFTAREE